MVKRRPPSPPRSRPIHKPPAGRCIKRRLRLPTATFFSKGRSLLTSSPISGLTLLKKISYRGGIIRKVRKMWSRLANRILPKRRTRALAPAPVALTMRAESFEFAKLGGRMEDRHFIHGPTVAVADGVGGFNERGIDPSEYAEELMQNALAAVVSVPTPVNPVEILRRAQARTTKQGGSTACIITLAGDELRFANVGDSGFKVFRGSTVAYESPMEQLHLGFNATDYLRAHREAKTVSEGRVRVEAGDLVVAGTDGLFDNLHTREIQSILESSEFGTDGVKTVAQTIAQTAFRNSMDRKYSSPFQAHALKHGLHFRGGKSDDITVVVARIESSSSSPPDDSNDCPSPSQPLPGTSTDDKSDFSCKPAPA